jgi:hypothetical protein
MFDTIYIYVPAFKQIIKISEGSGDNLTDEDLDAGYVDYIYYDTYELGCDIRELDGGMVMLTEPFQELFTCTADAISHVLDMAYCNDTLDYKILN